MATDIKEVRELYRRAIKCWKAEAQEGMLHEEIGELLVAINKYHRGKCTVLDICDELVDVEILLGQMRILFGIEDSDYAAKYMSKVMRLDQRLTEAEKKREE